MNSTLPESIQYVVVGLGIIVTILGIVKTTLEIKKLGNWKIPVIVVLIGIVLILFGVIFLDSFECKNPSISISQPADSKKVERMILVSGKADCLPKNSKIVLLIHHKQVDDIVGKWFIHHECAAIGKNGFWKTEGVEIGTSNTRNNSKYEVYAYGVGDSICNRLNNIVQRSNYTGSTNKPPQVIGVHDKINIMRGN